MNPVWNELITALHDSEHQCVLAITGGGSMAIGELLQVPGASRTLLEAVVPYASTALTDWLGGAAEQSCSESTARAMAMASWMRARELAPDADPHTLVGLGATASLASDRLKRGDHRAHIATQTSTSTTTYSVKFDKGVHGRDKEEWLVAHLVLISLGDACQIDGDQDPTNMPARSERIHVVCQDAEAEWCELLLGTLDHVGYPPSPKPQAILSGSFNPPHQGHARMAAIAASRLGCPVAFELSITNVDKPPLDFLEIDSRLKALRREDANRRVLLTDAPTFRAKSALFPGCTFVVGADTMVRIADSQYYTGEAGSFDAAIQQIADRGCRFLVFGREIEGDFRVLSDLVLPPALENLCDEVTDDEFREDVSSTTLRAQRPSES